MTVLGMAALTLVALRPAQDEPSRWLVRRSRDSVLVRQTSADGPLGFAFEDPPILALMCRSGALSAGVLPNTALAGAEPDDDVRAYGPRRAARFSYRIGFDGGPAPEREARLDAELPEIVVRDPARFVQDLLAHRTLSVTVTPARTRRPRTARFALGGLGAVVGRVLAACPAAGDAVPPAEGRWEIEADARRVFVSQVAQVDWPGATGGRASPELILRCVSGETEAYLFAREGLAEPEGDVLVRFDDEEKPKRYWGAPSRDGRSLFLTGYWSKGTEGFVKALLRHRSLGVTVVPSRGRALPEATFDLAGLDDALAEWKRACPLD